MSSSCTVGATEFNLLYDRGTVFGLNAGETITIRSTPDCRPIFCIAEVDGSVPQADIPMP